MLAASTTPSCSAPGLLSAHPKQPGSFSPTSPPPAATFTNRGLPLESTDNAGKCPLLMNFEKPKNYPRCSRSNIHLHILRDTKNKQSFYSSVLDLVSLTGFHPTDSRRREMKCLPSLAVQSFSASRLGLDHLAQCSVFQRLVPLALPLLDGTSRGYRGDGWGP